MFSSPFSHQRDLNLPTASLKPLQTMFNFPPNIGSKDTQSCVKHLPPETEPCSDTAQLLSPFVAMFLEGVGEAVGLRWFRFFPMVIFVTTQSIGFTSIFRIVNLNTVSRQSQYITVYRMICTVCFLVIQIDIVSHCLTTADGYNTLQKYCVPIWRSVHDI